MVASKSPKARTRTAVDLGRYAGLGFQFAATQLLFAAAGWWLDKKLGTGPWLLVAGVFLGAAGAFVSILRAVPKPRGRPGAERDRPGADPSDEARR